MTDESDGIGDGCYLVFFGLLGSFLTLLLAGWAVSVLWGWFVVPVFSAPSLGFSQAAGILVLLWLVKNLLVPIRVPKKNKAMTLKDWRRAGQALFLRVFMILMSVVVGWLIRGFAP